jgi:predicted TIM-barrel fold metal-dependent hydrolase
LIDTCVHHGWRSETEIHPYIEDGWREYVGKPGSLPMGFGARRLTPRARFRNPAGEYVAGAGSDEKAPITPASLIERASTVGADRLLLLFGEGLCASSHPNPYYARAVVRAINDWNADQWLSHDPRLCSAVLVPDQVPSEAADEIRRVGGHPQIVGVLLGAPSLGRLLGHPVYHPIYEAAAALNLPVILHRGFDALPDLPTGPAAGLPSTFAEHQVVAPLSLETNVISLITNGVLAKYADLRLFIVGAGVSWIEPTLLRLDQLWKALRQDLPWVRESPTTYFERQIRVSTYGLEGGHSAERLRRHMEATGRSAGLLCYGSGYPSWDTTEREDVESIFPSTWHEQIMTANAAAWFRWPAAFEPVADGSLIASPAR